MPASPTSTLSSSARRALRAAAHHLDPVVMMGQHGLTPAVLHEIDLALTAHALIKVRAGSDEREIRDGFLAEICAKLGCESVQHLGKLFVLWRNADGAGSADKSAEQDAAAVKSSTDPHALKERGPRSKLPSERAAERANATSAPAGRAGGYTSARTASGAGGRGAPAGGRGAPAGARSDTATGPRWRYGEAPPDAPRREGWAPKDRRGAARFGATEGSDDSRRRDGPPSYGATRGRSPASGGGYAGSTGNRGSGGGRSGYGGNAPSGAGSAGGRSGYGGGSRDAAGGGQGHYEGGGQGRNSGGQTEAAPRARWGDRRGPAQGGGGFGGSEGSGGGFDRGAPRPPRTGGYGGSGSGNSAGGAAPAGGRGGWDSRDGVTGKPSGFSRGGAGGGARGGVSGGVGSAAPRARRRFG